MRKGGDQSAIAFFSYPLPPVAGGRVREGGISVPIDLCPTRAMKERSEPTANRFLLPNASDHDFSTYCPHGTHFWT
jgi:hypothetical protein